jgi:hypothetical protein
MQRYYFPEDSDFQFCNSAILQLFREPNEHRALLTWNFPFNHPEKAGGKEKPLILRRIYKKRLWRL